ncbi:MAG: biotin/lipoyl-binding protein, partial [bacterium]|nr:biotin/lipoyl-binding protein [bacterium]
MQIKYLSLKYRPEKHQRMRHGSVIVTCLVVLFLLTAYSTLSNAAQCTGDFCEKHQLAEKDCPWCNSNLIKELGWCNGHNMAEAFCYRCNAKLKAGFIAENDWCEEHQVPESQCTLCGSTAKTAKKSSGDFCDKHQLAEKDCPWCNPNLVKELGWCNGHDMAEAFCYRCNAKLKAGFIAENDWCKEHQVPESQCTLCGAPPKARLPKETKSNQPRIFRAPAGICKTDTLKVQLKSPAFAKAAGFEFFKASKQPLETTIHRNAEIEYNRKKYARLSSPVPGIIKTLRVEPGQSVKAGDILLLINSADVGRAKSEYLQARATVELWKQNYRRETELLKLNALEKKRILQTQNKLTQFRLQLSRAIGTLNNLGYSKGHMEKIAKD